MSFSDPKICTICICLYLRSYLNPQGQSMNWTISKNLNLQTNCHCFLSQQNRQTDEFSVGFEGGGVSYEEVWASMEMWMRSESHGRARTSIALKKNAVKAIAFFSKNLEHERKIGTGTKIIEVCRICVRFFFFFFEENLYKREKQIRWSCWLATE